MSTAGMCCCLTAVTEPAPEPHTEAGQYYGCLLHRQMVIWDGQQWLWAEWPDAIGLPRTADSAAKSALPD